MYKRHLLILLAALIVGCGNKDFPECGSLFGGSDGRLRVKNTSNKDITVVLNYNYPDTTLQLLTKHYIELPSFIIVPGENETQRIRGCWDYIFRDLIPSGRLQIFIFDVDTIKNVPWNDIQANHTVLKRYEYTMAELVAMNWQVVY